MTTPPALTGITDLHVHTSPSLLARHDTDPETVRTARALGVATLVLKAHEGCTAARAQLAGAGVYGGIVLNSPVGGANPDAVEVTARLGGRVVWAPTVSAPAHQAAQTAPELQVHRSLTFRQVDLVGDDGALLPAWHEVLDVAAAHDMLLASGHLTAHQTVTLFTAARSRGVRRLLVNHPLLAFLSWTDEIIDTLLDLDAHLELGIIPDLLPRHDGRRSTELPTIYPPELCVFGGDTGHTDFPSFDQALPGWLTGLERHAGPSAEAIMTTNGANLLDG